MSATQSRKHCPKCDTIKPLTQFQRSRANKDGRQSYCANCNNQRMRQYNRTPEQRKRLLFNQRGVKGSARAAVKYAVKTGKLKKPDACAQCHHPGPVEGHHEDYSQPLKVVWLCRSCHIAVHQNQAT